MSLLPNTAPNSAFWQKMQLDYVNLTELIDFEFPSGVVFHWTTTNGHVTYTLSGAPTTYVPFPGMTPGGLKSTNNLAVAAVNFVMQNTGSNIADLLLNDFQNALVKVGRVFVDTPNLGRMEVYQGQVGDYTYNRNQITGQARNVWKSLNIVWPYYSFQDTCRWRFGSKGCGYNTSSVTIAISSVNVGSSTTLAILVASGMISASYSNDRFDWGRVTALTGANSGVVRTCRVQTGDLLIMGNAFPYSVDSLTTLSIFPGCQKQLIANCRSQYNNEQNFLGWPWITLQPLPQFIVGQHGGVANAPKG